MPRRVLNANQMSEYYQKFQVNLNILRAPALRMSLSKRLKCLFIFVHAKKNTDSKEQTYGNRITNLFQTWDFRCHMVLAIYFWTDAYRRTYIVLPCDGQ